MIDSKWPNARIDSFGEVLGGRQRSPKAKGDMTPYLRVANVFAGRIDFNDVLQMPFTKDERERYRLEPGDVLLNEGQSLELIGRSAIYQGELPECCFQNTLVRFRPHRSADSGFAQMYFEHLRKLGVFATIGVQTTSIAHLGVNRFASLHVPLPPLEVRTAIVQLLTPMCRALNSLNESLRTHRHRNKGLMRELLAGRRRFPEFRKSEWDSLHLSDITKESSHRNGQIEDRSRVYSVTNDRGMIPMPDGTIGADLERYKTCSRDWFAYNPMRLNIGSISRWTGTGNVLVSPDYVVFRCGKRLLPEFLDHFRRGPDWKRHLHRVGDGSVRVRIYYRDLAQMPIRLPSLEEQRKIADVLTAADREIELLEDLREAIDRQKRGLMHRLLTGEMALPESLIEKLNSEVETALQQLGESS